MNMGKEFLLLFLFFWVVLIMGPKNSLLHFSQFTIPSQGPLSDLCCALKSPFKSLKDPLEGFLLAESILAGTCHT